MRPDDRPGRTADTTSDVRMIGAYCLPAGGRWQPAADMCTRGFAVAPNAIRFLGGAKCAAQLRASDTTHADQCTTRCVWGGEYNQILNPCMFNTSNQALSRRRRKHAIIACDGTPLCGPTNWSYYRWHRQCRHTRRRCGCFDTEWGVERRGQMKEATSCRALLT